MKKFAEEDATREERKVQILTFPTREAAREAFLRKDVRGYYIIPAGFLHSGRIDLEIRKAGIMKDDMPARWLILRWIQASLIEGPMDGDLAQRAWMPADIKATILTETGSESKSGKALDFIMPYFFTILFMISIIGSAGYLLQGVAEEKENRVMEVLVSSVTPNQLLAGKVLGLGAAGLTQLFAWILIAVAPAAYMMPSLQLRWSQFFVALVYFLLGFFLYGTLMGGTGALYSNYRESQQSSVIWSMSAVSPMFVLVPLLQDPNGVLARVMSYFPLTAPVTMMLRISAAKVAAWDVALSMLIMASSLFLFLRLGGKMFRVGILMYGKRPSLVEIVRWVRAA